MDNKIGVVDVGGGYRGIYAAGVLDHCLDNDIHFDVCIGVSAGSANLASYMAGQARRNRRFYADYGLRPEYMSLRNYLKKRNLLDLDYIYGTLSNSDGESPLDYAAMLRNPAEYLAVTTEAETGHVRYFSKYEMQQDDYRPLCASSCIPTVCRAYHIDGIPYYDGALADPIPIEKAFAMGCEKVVLLLTLPEDTIRTDKTDRKLAAGIRKRYPIAAAQLARRAAVYNECVAKAQEYAAQGKLLIVAPRTTCGVGTLCRDAQAMLDFYQNGYRDGERIAAFLQKS